MITPQNTLLYEELHIEQSGVCELNGADAGIVCDGIGGAIRETVTAAPRAYEILEVTPENPHRMIILDTQGMETHTGGTPPNRTLTKQDGKVLYRRDALVAASHLISRLLKAAESRNLKHHIKIIKSAPPKQTGFSTVPSGQEIRLLVSEAAHKQVAYLISYILTDIMEEFDLWGGMKTEEITEGRFQVIFGKDLDAIEIPAVVEQLVREEVNSQILDGKSGFGTVRGTVTDFSMDAEKGTSFKLDLRDVDTGAIASIRGQIHSRIMDLLPAKIEVLDEKPYTPVDGAAAETKKEIARTLGLSTIAMPSLPGHDAASLGRAGIPVTMTFIAHNGISHSPSETITEENYAKAEKLSHAYLESLLF